MGLNSRVCLRTREERRTAQDSGLAPFFGALSSGISRCAPNFHYTILLHFLSTGNLHKKLFKKIPKFVQSAYCVFWVYVLFYNHREGKGTADTS